MDLLFNDCCSTIVRVNHELKCLEVIMNERMNAKLVDLVGGIWRRANSGTVLILMRVSGGRGSRCSSGGSGGSGGG